ADLRAKMTRELRRFGENLALVPAEERPGATLDEAAVRRALGEAAAPVLLARGEIGRADGRPADGGMEAAAILGIDVAAYGRLHPFWRVDGAWPQKDDEALVGSAVARRLGLFPGERVTLTLESGGGPIPLRAVGTVRTGEAEEDQVFVPLHLLQEASGLTGRVSLATLFVAGGPDDVDSVARRLERDLPGARARL